MENKGDFSHGSIARHLMRLALPVMFAEFVNILYNVVDRMFIGRIPGTGTLALSGLGIVFPLISLINAFAGLFGTGGAPLCSIEMGRGDDEYAGRILETSFTMLLIVGLFVSLLFYLTLGLTLPLLGSDPDTFTYARDYFSIYLIGSIFVMVSLGMNPFINMQGSSVTGMITVMLGAALNIILDPIFIFVLNMGVRGAAIATVIAQFCSALWVVLFLTRRARLRIRCLRLDAVIVRRILKLGVTGFMFKATNSVTQAIANMTLRAFGGSMGTLFIGSMSIINSTREISQLPVSGFTSGFQPIAGYNYGAKKYSRVRSILKLTGVICLAINILLWMLIELFPSSLIGIFTPDAELIRAAVPCMRIYFAVFFCMAGQMMGQNTFVAMNLPRYAVFFSLFRKVILVVPLTLLLPRLGLGAYGVFTAEAISQGIGGSVCFITMMIHIYRKLRKARDDEDISF